MPVDSGFVPFSIGWLLQIRPVVLAEKTRRNRGGIEYWKKGENAGNLDRSRVFVDAGYLLLSYLYLRNDGLVSLATHSLFSFFTY